MKLTKPITAYLRGDMRSNLASFTVVALVVIPLVFFAASRFTAVDETNHDPTVMVYMSGGILGGMATVIIVSILGEMYTQRLNGTLMRVRTLPNGTTIWVIGTTISATLRVLLMVVIFLIAYLMTDNGSSLTIGSVLLIVVISIVAALAAAPIGFILGSVARGTYTYLAALLASLVVITTSGIFFPLHIMPRWLQIIQTGLPFYWASYVGRWAVGYPNAHGYEVTATYHPALAWGVLIAWAVIGAVLAVVVLKRMFQRTTLTSVAQLQAKVRAQSGV